VAWRSELRARCTRCCRCAARASWYANHANADPGGQADPMRKHRAVRCRRAPAIAAALASQSLRLCKVRGSLVRRAGLKDEAAKQRPNRWVDLSRQRDSMVNAIASLFAERTATFALVTLKSRRSIVRRAPMNRCAQPCLRLFQVISACERKLVLDPSDVHALFARGV
jgi:hypothetical protein